MKNIIKIFAITCLLAPLSLMAKDKWSSQGQVVCKLEISPGMSFSLRGAGHFGSFLDQVEHLEKQITYDTGRTEADSFPWRNWGNEISFDKAGLNGGLIALGFVSEFTTFGNVKISGGGEILVQSKPMTLIHRDSLLKIDRTVPLSFFEVAPAGMITLSLPFSEGFDASLVNRIERRLFRSPTDTTVPYGELEPIGYSSSFRYTATVSIHSPDLTPLRIAPLIYYEGMTQGGAKGHLVGWGYGFSMRPMKKFAVTFADRIRWDPNLLHTTTHQLFVEAQFMLGFSGK